MAEVLQRLLAQEGLRLLEEAQGGLATLMWTVPGGAQEAADAELSASRSGIDETEEGAAAKLAAIRDGLARGLSPQQIAATTPGLSASTVYRWVWIGNTYLDDSGRDSPASLNSTGDM